MESILYYSNTLGIDPIMLGLFSFPILSLFIYTTCCSRPKSGSRKNYEKRFSIVENSVKVLYEHVLKYNARLEGLELNVGKMLVVCKDIDILKQDISDMTDANEEFNKLYNQFCSSVMNELRILHDATFVPDEPGQNEDDSDYEP